MPTIDVNRTALYYEIREREMSAAHDAVGPDFDVRVNILDDSTRS